MIKHQFASPKTNGVLSKTDQPLIEIGVKRSRPNNSPGEDSNTNSNKLLTDYYKEIPDEHASRLLRETKDENERIRKENEALIRKMKEKEIEIEKQS